ncbi:MAG: hypothetical protein L6461_05985 [Anaerolineae bacterium]|nr:hypothetical protein [Anaerolineae bacterium]
MSQQNTKYKTMARIAIIANWVAWILLITACISVLDNIINFDKTVYDGYVTMEKFSRSSSGLLEPFFPTISALMPIINSLTYGVYSFLILRAISLGLFMLIEIDLDIKLIKEGAGNE